MNFGDILGLAGPPFLKNLCPKGSLYTEAIGDFVFLVVSRWVLSDLLVV